MQTRWERWQEFMAVHESNLTAAGRERMVERYYEPPGSGHEADELDESVTEAEVAAVAGLPVARVNELRSRAESRARRRPRRPAAES